LTAIQRLDKKISAILKEMLRASCSTSWEEGSTNMVGSSTKWVVLQTKEIGPSFTDTSWNRTVEKCLSYLPTKEKSLIYLMLWELLTKIEKEMSLLEETVKVT
jgi:hypothetical protein